MAPELPVGARCCAHNRQTTKHATDLVWLYSNQRLAKRAQEQDMAQPLVVLSEEDEEEKWSSRGGEFRNED